jgi:2,5-diketo-D-gluconate reductase A
VDVIVGYNAGRGGDLPVSGACRGGGDAHEQQGNQAPSTADPGDYHRVMTQSQPTPTLPHDVVTLESGAQMPLLGFGTWQITGKQAVSATAAALEAGFRHIDTATVYGNESEVGKALRDSGVAREDVFLTTKCPPNKAGSERDTLQRSLDALGTDHVDLWLIHWPGANQVNLDLWRGFIDARESGLARDIGVSNFGVEMIDDFTATTRTTPVVNQIEWSPLLFDRVSLDEHRARGVALEGYSALRGGTLDHPDIVRVARRTGRTPAQVIIRWHLQHGIIVIPKSRNPERIRSNADVGGFELSAEDMATLDGLGRSS